jgi:hypothetical protein
MPHESRRGGLPGNAEQGSRRLVMAHRIVDGISVDPTWPNLALQDSGLSRRFLLRE